MTAMVAYRRWKFTVLLVALLLLLVVHPLVSGDASFLALLALVLFLVVVVAALVVSLEQKKSRVTALVLGIPAIAGIVASNVVPASSPGLESIFLDFLPAAFIVYTVVMILRSIFMGTAVTADSISGALCGYLLIGLVFGNLFCLIEAFWPGSFHLRDVPDSVLGTGGRHSLLRYFSLVTLTTVGYGDITPNSAPARTLAWLEAMTGQFYVAVIIAGLVALRVSTAIRRQGTP